ncbi:MAG: DUF6062 family protein, partial [Thermofilum sp.]|nr:DUF6062 family protein [Thermofilum sp.]
MFLKKPRASDKDVVYLALVDAISKGGCPICRALEKSENNLIWIILYEHVNDPYVREKIDRGNGFCGYHYQKIMDMAKQDPLIGGLGPAIIVEDLLNRFVESIKSGTLLETKCYVCSELERAEESYTSSFTSKLETTDLLSRYENNPGSLLCYKHFTEIYSMTPEPFAKRLKEVQLKKLNKLLEELRSYISKHDYRHIGTITETEAKSWTKAIEAITGSGWSSQRPFLLKGKIA